MTRALTRLPVLVALLVVAASIAAAVTYVVDRDGAADLLAEPADSVVAAPSREAPSAACSACAARHQRLQRNRQSEE